MRLKKIVISGLLLFCILPVIFFTSIQMYLQISFPEKKTKQLITGFFKKEIKKAVKFDSASLDLLGNITLNNFDLSAANDFNDNLSLVKCQKVYIDLQLIPLILGRITIDSIFFSEASILFYKRYGISYDEYIHQFDSFYDFSEMIKSDTNQFTDDLQIIFVDSDITYKEVFKETKTVLAVHDSDFQINIEKGGNSFFLNGEIVSLSDDSAHRGSITINGMEKTGNGEGTFAVVVDNFDLSLINNHIAEYFNPFTILKGSASVDLNITTEQKRIRIGGKCEADNFKIITLKPRSRSLLLNDNVNIQFDVESEDGWNHVKLHRFRINDACVDVWASGEYEKEKMLDIEFASNNIDLETLSSYFTPFEEYSLSGTLQARGTLSVDQKVQKIKKSDLYITARNCSIKDAGRGGDNYLLQNLNFIAEMKGDALMFSYSSDIGKSDCHIAAKTRIKDWFPLQSDTILAGRMNRIDVSLAGRVGKNIIEGLFSAAYEDQKKGYDDEYFLKSTAGKILNNNNIKIDISINRIVIDEKWKDIGKLSSQWILDRGLLGCKQFNLTGGDVKYNFNLLCNFNTDQPYLKFDGRVGGFKIEDYAPKGISRGLTGGTADIDFDYDLSFYRFANFIENSKGNFSILFRDGTLKNTGIQRDFSLFLKNNGIAIQADVFIYKEIKLNVACLAENVYISNTSIQSDDINAAIYGKYTYLDGYEATVNASIRDTESLNHSVSMSCRGSLANPCFKMRATKDAREFCIK